MIGLALLLAAMAPAAGPARHSTDVKTAHDDDLTLKFADAIRAALVKAKHLRPYSGDDEDDLVLAVLDVTPAKGRFDYAVDLLKTGPTFAPKRIGSFTGRCRENALADCSSKLVGHADGKARD